MKVPIREGSGGAAAGGECRAKPPRSRRSMNSVALSQAARCQNQLGVAFLASLTVDAFAARAWAQARHLRPELGRRGARRAVKFIAQQAAQFIRSLRRVVRAVDAPALGGHCQHRPGLRQSIVRLVRGNKSPHRQGIALEDGHGAAREFSGEAEGPVVLVFRQHDVAVGRGRDVAVAHVGVVPAKGCRQPSTREEACTST